MPTRGLITSAGSIVVPPDAFFQAVAEAEQAIVAAMLAVYRR